MREHEQRPPEDSDKSPHERFEELGKRLMAVPKPELDAREKRWQAERERTKKKR